MLQVHKSEVLMDNSKCTKAVRKLVVNGTFFYQILSYFLALAIILIGDNKTKIKELLHREHFYMS